MILALYSALVVPQPDTGPPEQGKHKGRSTAQTHKQMNGAVRLPRGEAEGLVRSAEAQGDATDV